MIVITGASDGLGRELARLYQHSHAHVVNISRRESDYAANNILCDLATEEGVSFAAQSVLGFDERIDVLINCAGVLTLEPLGQVTWHEIDRTMKINVYAPILLTSLLLERLKIDESDIVNIGSTASLRPYKGQLVCDASKHALRSFTEDIKLELENSPNRVIGVYPGMFDSDISQKVPHMKLGKSKHPVIGVAELAQVIKSTFELPKVMEVGDIVINRKVVRS